MKNLTWEHIEVLHILCWGNVNALQTHHVCIYVCKYVSPFFQVSTHNFLTFQLNFLEHYYHLTVYKFGTGKKNHIVLAFVDVVIL
jgi:hypothetical protein